MELQYFNANKIGRAKEIVGRIIEISNEKWEHHDEFMNQIRQDAQDEERIIAEEADL